VREASAVQRRCRLICGLSIGFDPGRGEAGQLPTPTRWSSGVI